MRGEGSVGTVVHDGIVEGREDSGWRWLRRLFENGYGEGIRSHVSRRGNERVGSEGVIDWIWRREDVASGWTGSESNS